MGVLRDDVIGLGRGDSERVTTVWDLAEASDSDAAGLKTSSVQMKELLRYTVAIAF